MCGPHWWLRSYSSQASEGCKLRAVFIFNLLRAAFFSVLQFLASLVALIRLHDAWRTNVWNRNERRAKENDNDKTIPVITHT